MARISKCGLIAKKIGMTRVCAEDGVVTPVTLLQVEKQVVTKVLDKDKDGYCAFQLGYQVKAKKNLTKADHGRLSKVNIKDSYSKFSEFRILDNDSYALGKTISAEIFKDISSVDVTGISKGKGFQGAVKRWGASIGRKTHGSRFQRRPGSLGQCTTPGRVYKNKHQPGRMGTDKVTVSNVRIIDIDIENNIIAIKGSVPGHKECYLEVRESNRA